MINIFYDDKNTKTTKYKDNETLRTLMRIAKSKSKKFARGREDR